MLHPLPLLDHPLEHPPQLRQATPVQFPVGLTHALEHVQALAEFAIEVGHVSHTTIIP